MPIYAYRCSSCGHARDVLRKMSDAPLTTCPVCHAETFTKQLTAAGFQLKGSGWYVTDFKGGAASPAAPAVSGAAAEGGGAKPSGEGGGSTPAGGGSGSAGGGSGSAGGGAAGGGTAGGGTASSGGGGTTSAASCGGSCACH